MSLKFDKKGRLISQKVRFVVKHDELDEEFIDKYIKNECDFGIEYNKRGEPQIIRRDEKRK